MKYEVRFLRQAEKDIRKLTPKLKKKLSSVDFQVRVSARTKLAVGTCEPLFPSLNGQFSDFASEAVVGDVFRNRIGSSAADDERLMGPAFERLGQWSAFDELAIHLKGDAVVVDGRLDMGPFSKGGFGGIDDGAQSDPGFADNRDAGAATLHEDLEAVVGTGLRGDYAVGFRFDFDIDLPGP